MLKKTKEFRLAEWKKILAEANTSGMSKRAWCKANGISERKLYYWQHRIWQTESTGHHLSEKQELSVSPSGSLPDNRFVEVDLHPVSQRYGRLFSLPPDGKRSCPSMQ